jgi:GntR family transcriptional regulator
MEYGKVIELTELDIRPVDPSSPVPFYHQVESDLRRLINEGKLQPNALIPPELELCQAYGVGRQTIRTALSRLAADNLIVRRAGWGTMVNPVSDRSRFYLDRSFTQQMADMGRKARSQVLEKESCVIGPDSPTVFRDKIGEPCFRLVRLRFGDNEPIGLQSTIILVDSCKELEQVDFNNTGLYDALATKCQMIISRIDHVISAVIADQYQAGHLGVSEGDPLLVVKTMAYLDNNQIVEYTVSYYRADKYEYATSHILVK